MQVSDRHDQLPGGHRVLQPPAVEIKSLSKDFGAARVLDQIDLAVSQRERLAVIGPSGSGKSTLLRVLMTLEPPSGGRIWIHGAPLWHEIKNGRERPATKRHLRNMRRELGMVFQSFNLFPHMTALENIVVPLRHHRDLSKTQSSERAYSYLEMVGLVEKAHSHPAQLSGGQQQRVAIARALALRPRVLLLDEVTSALDPELVGEVLLVIRRIAADHSTTMLMVTHEMRFARDVSDRVVFMDQGRIVEVGRPDEIFTSPSNPRTRTFLRSVLEADKLTQTGESSEQGANGTV
jgi:polar amino acid transport system ATP-binding protein